MWWRDRNGNLTEYSVKCAWEALRPRGLDVSWCDIVWFSHGIPRHAFHLWLIMRRCLKTQDKLRSWDVSPTMVLSSLRCSLCGLHMDSHEHLFFECDYSAKIWCRIRNLAGMDTVPPVLEDIVAWLQPMAAKRSISCIVGKLLFAAASYYVWSERNNRLFKNTRRTHEELCDLIIIMIRLKLVSFKFKNKPRVTDLLKKWNMPTGFRIYS